MPALTDLIESGLTTIVVSIDGSTQETYEQYRVGGNLGLVLENAAKIIDRRNAMGRTFPLIEWQFLALKRNVDQIDDAMRLARAIGFDIFRYGGARGVLANRITKPTSENYSESSEILLGAEHPLSEYTSEGEKRHDRELAGCRWLWGKMAIHSDGGVAPCWTGWRRNCDLGNAREATLRELWLGEGFASGRRAAVAPDAAPANACSVCARNKAFVNAPERAEGPVSSVAVRNIYDTLKQGGLQPSVEVCELVCDLLTMAAHVAR